MLPTARIALLVFVSLLGTRAIDPGLPGALPVPVRSGFAPEPCKIQIAHLVPPGQVLLRWQPGAEPDGKPAGWKISRYIITALDSSTSTTKDYSVYPPTIPCIPLPNGECLEGTFEVTPDAGKQLMLDANKDGKHHYAHITVHDMRYDEYSFPRYTLDAGYFAFSIVACAVDMDNALADDEWCSPPSKDSSPLVPVPGHTVKAGTGDNSEEQPGVCPSVKALFRGKGISRTLTISWADPEPDLATSFVVLANPNNDTSKRFAVSDRLYANRRELVLQEDMITSLLIHSCDTSKEDCVFTFQVAAIHVNTHGVPSANSNAVNVVDQAENVDWSVPGEVNIDEETSVDDAGRIVVSWKYNSPLHHTGFILTCYKKQEPKLCTGTLSDEATSFAFDRSMLEDQSFFSFQVQATNLGVYGPGSNVTDPVKTNWPTDQVTLIPPLLITEPPLQFRSEYSSGNLRLVWDIPGEEYSTRIAVKKHDNGNWTILEEALSHSQMEYVIDGVDNLILGMQQPGRPHGAERRAEGDLGTYDFAVAAVNSLGAGPWSSVLRVLVGAKHPAAPQHPMKVGSLQRLDRITIGWAMPEHNGGLPIDKFKLAVIRTSDRPIGVPDPAIPLEDVPEPAQLIEVGKISEYEVLHLEPATSYSFRVAAHNGVGWSSLSETSRPLNTASLVAPDSNYWVKRMKEALAICVTIFLVTASICGACIYVAYKQQEQDGSFDHQPNAWTEFKQMVDAEQSKGSSTSRFDDDDLL